MCVWFVCLFIACRVCCSHSKENKWKVSLKYFKATKDWIGMLTTFSGWVNFILLSSKTMLYNSESDKMSRRKLFQLSLCCLIKITLNAITIDWIDVLLLLFFLFLFPLLPSNIRNAWRTWKHKNKIYSRLYSESFRAMARWDEGML